MIAKKQLSPKNSTFCKGIISIYRKEDLERESKDKAIKKEGRLKNEAPFKVSSIESYAFYPDTINSARIGSVAVYGVKAFTHCETLPCLAKGFWKRKSNMGDVPS